MAMPSGQITERERRELAVNTFETDLERARDAWMSRRILPYVRCYGTAFAWYSHTLRQMNQRIATEHAQYIELFTAVALIVGPAVLSMAPVAACIKGIRTQTSRLSTYLSAKASRLGLGNQANIDNALQRFMFGVPGAGMQMYSGPIKDYLKGEAPAVSQVVRRGQDDRAFIGSGPPGAVPDTAIQRAWLEQLFWDIAAQLLARAIDLRDNPRAPHDTVEGLRAELDRMRQSEFMSSAAGLQAFTTTQLNQLRDRMEKALWAFWLISNIERQEHQISNYAQGYAAAALRQGGDRYRDAQIPRSYTTFTPVPDEIYNRLVALEVRVPLTEQQRRAVRLNRGVVPSEHLLGWAQNYIQTSPMRPAALRSGTPAATAGADQ